MHIELPEKLADQVEEIYEKAGYGSRTEFVRDAARRQVEQYIEQ